MIPKECKRLAEVDFPIAVVSKHSAREKSIRHGHPSTLHLWWARRPLAACRAMLLALLLPDPVDRLCPDEFKEKARKLLPPLIGKIGSKEDDLRKGLLKFIGDFANWDMASDPVFLEVGRGLVKAAHPDEMPLVVDPFAGGGSIPLETLRLGCEAFASDLNPVACLILKVMLEDVPRYGSELAKELLKVGSEIKNQAEKELAEFYPKDPDGAVPIAYLWTRTVKCESPNCGAEIPIIRSFWLCTKNHRKQAIKYSVVRSNNKPPRIEFEIFVPKKNDDVPAGTTTNGKVSCPACNAVLPNARVQSQLREKSGGAADAKLLAIIVSNVEQKGRRYRLPTQSDFDSLNRVSQKLASRMEDQSFPSRLSEKLSPIRPSPNARGVSAPTRYGVSTFGDLFTQRQLLSLMTIAQLISARKRSTSTPIHHLLALAFDKMTIQCNAHCRWKASGESLVDMFGRHALSMVWDFAEATPLGKSTGGWDAAIQWISNIVTTMGGTFKTPGQVSIQDACASPLPDEAVNVWFTDPPYYDNIPYADLSDFFFVWLKRTIGTESLSNGIGNAIDVLTPKDNEAVWNQAHIVKGKPKDRDFFENAIAKACTEGRRILSENGIGCVVFAHKTTEGWEALLTGIVNSGWSITASWPIATEMTSRVSARDSASLATSVHLVCRPRPENAPVGDWGDVLKELPNRVGDWMERLQGEGIRGADLVFACIGPALEIFSRYRKVETADGREVKLAEYLERVWEVVGRQALEQVLGTAEAKARNGAAGSLEEDARLTALFLWTLQSSNGNYDNVDETNDDDDEDDNSDSSKIKTKGFSLVYDVVRRFAQPLGIELPKWENRIIETSKGVVRLMAVSERARQLFGDDGAKVAADWIEEDPTQPVQLRLFPEMEKAQTPKVLGRKRGRLKLDLPAESASQVGVTTLDRVHAAMLLQSGGQANALRILIKAEQDRGSDFLRLANSLSALYPNGSEEKRLLDAMLLGIRR